MKRENGRNFGGLKELVPSLPMTEKDLAVLVGTDIEFVRDLRKRRLLDATTKHEGTVWYYEINAIVKVGVARLLYEKYSFVKSESDRNWRVAKDLRLVGVWENYEEDLLKMFCAGRARLFERINISD